MRNLQEMKDQFGNNNGAADFLLDPPDNYQMAMVSEFIFEFGGSLDPVFWATMCLEEAEELQEAYDDDDWVNCAKELADLRYVMIGLTLCLSEHSFKLINPEQHKIVDIMGEASACIVEFLTDIGKLYDLDSLDEAFYRVHESNMTKLGRDGKPIRNEVGKVMKGPDYMPPTLDDLFEFECFEVEPNEIKDAA